MESFNEFMPIFAALLGVLVSWLLSSKYDVLAWFGKLAGWGKLLVVFAACLLFGAVQYFGFSADLVESIKQVLLMFLGSQVGYVMKPSGAE